MEKKDNKNAHCYTYKVTMIIQVLADDEKTAREQLDSQGGHLTDRKVELKDSVALYSKVDKEKE